MTSTPVLQRARKQGRRFLNPVPTRVGGLPMLFKILPELLRRNGGREPARQPGPFVTDPRVYEREPASGLRVTWFGHSALLLEIDGVRVLVDPVFDERASPVRWTGPKRFFPATIRWEDMPALDAVLISHDHYDHLGRDSVKALARLNASARAVWVTSAGVGRLLRRFGVAPHAIRELDWTQSTEVTGRELGHSLRVTAWPSRHFSGRAPWNRFGTLWSSFVLEGPRHRVFFGADTGMWDGFAAIAAEYDRFDLTLLEIGAFHELWAAIHLGPDGAAAAYRQMGGPRRAGWLLPIHWGLFNLALHPWKQPIERMLELEAAEGLPLWLPEPGRPTEVSPTGREASRWWQAF